MKLTALHTLFFHIIVIICQLPLVLEVEGLPATLKVAIILPEEEKDAAIDFGYKFGLHVLNGDRGLMPNTTIVAEHLYYKSGDSFRSSKRLCRILEDGIVAILGSSSPTDPALEWKLFWMSATLDVPLLLPKPAYTSYYRKSSPSPPVTSMVLPPPKSSYKLPGAQRTFTSTTEFAVRLAPTLDMWSQVLRELVLWLNIENLAILYENELGLMKIQSLLKLPVSIPHNIIVRRVWPDIYLYTLDQLKNSNIRQLLVDCDVFSLPHLLKAIESLKMTDYRYHFILTNMDVGTADLSDFIRSHVNITTFQIVDQHSRFILEKYDEIRSFGAEHLPPHVWDRETPSIQTEAGLAFDSVTALGLGLANLDLSHNLQPSNLSCEKETSWPDGLSLLNYITAVDFKGMTGPISFKEGDRSDVKINIMRLRNSGLKNVGYWTPESHLNITNPSAFWETDVPNVTLVVTTVLENPYVQLKPDQNLTGNARFEGFSVDLLEIIAKHVGFQYLIQIVPDGVYGVSDPETGEWNGVVRQLIEKNVDLAIGSMTINVARESVIDFTKPFMNLGISILFRVPTKSPARLFSFLKPLGLEIWLAIIVSYVLVSLTLFIVARFSPHEWTSTTATIKYTRGSAVGVVQNQFTLANAFWYPIGTLMQQGSDLNPRTASTRLIGGFWWFFSLVIVSSYTANLAAFLTVERMSTPIQSAEDLAGQTEISYGILKSGSTMSFFRDSKIETYQKMWRFMESKSPSVFVKTYEDGIQRVLEDGAYAFLMESTMLDYVVKQNCNLTQIGGLLDNKGYGIATPIGSPWRDKISLAILELQEKGTIQWYYNKWWTRKDPEMEECEPYHHKLDSKAAALGVDSIGGVFVVLVAGLMVAIVVSILEFCWHAKRNATSDHVSLCSEMAEEARFACRCRGPRRRPLLVRHCARCDIGHSKSHLPTAYHDYNTYPHVHRTRATNVNPQSSTSAGC